jgi:hypothetical protein
LVSAIVSGILFLVSPPYHQLDNSKYAINETSSTLLLPDLYYLNIKKLMNYLFYAAIISFFLLGFQEPELNMPKYFIHYKIDGKNYLQANCKNCITGRLLGDTAFLLTSNTGIPTLKIGVSDGAGVVIKSYSLNRFIGSQGIYDNSPLEDDVLKQMKYLLES